MADLRTDYKDDLLNTEANELRKYQMIQNDDGTVSFVDVTEYLQVGDSFGSADVNAITAAVSDKLPLSGGTMTGDITSQNVYPVEGSKYHCGETDKPFAKVHSNYFNAMGSDGAYYGQMIASTLGTATTQGLGDVWVGNGTAKGTDGNAKGRVIIFNSGANYALIQDHDSATTNRTLTLPRSSGQIPVVSVSGTTLNINF